MKRAAPWLAAALGLPYAADQFESVLSEAVKQAIPPHAFLDQMLDTEHQVAGAQLQQAGRRAHPERWLRRRQAQFARRALQSGRRRPAPAIAGARA